MEAADRKLTYAELDAFAERTAALLRSRGCSVEQPIGVALGRSAFQIGVILGIWRAGATYVPVDPELPRARRERVCTEAGVSLMIVGPIGEPVVSRDRVAVTLLELDEIEQAPPSDDEFPDPRSDHLAYLLFTSGSTAAPKRVGIEHGSLVVLGDALGAAYSLDPRDRVLQLSSTAWDTHLEEIVPALMCGATLLIPRWSRPTTLVDVTDLAARRRATVVSLPTALWSPMARAGIEWPPSVRITVVGGEPMRKTDAAAWMNDCHGSRSRLFNTYGMTESCAVSALCEVTADRTEGDQPFVPIGFAINGTRLMVLDEQGLPVGPEEVGGLAIAGAGISREANDASPPLLLTGDRAFLDESGRFVCVGRRDDQVKVSGARVSLLEVEAALLSQDSVEGAAVIPEPDSPDGRLAALVQCLPGKAISDTTLRRSLAEVLISSAVPGRIEFVSSLPRLPSGKIDRPAVRERLAVRSPERVDAATDPVLEQVLSAVAEGVGLPRVDPDHHFLDVGGDSLTAMIVVARLGALGFVDAEVERLLGTPSIRGFAEGLTPVDGLPDGGTPSDSVGDEGHALTSGQLLAYEAATDGRGGPQAYLDQDVWSVEGDLDPDAMRSAWEFLIRRHSSLRASIRHTPEGIGQVTQDAVEVPLVERDLRGVDEISQAATLREICDGDLWRPLDLARAPLFRLHLIRRGERTWWLVWTVHRLVLDGWSTAIALRDLLTAYSALLKGATPKGLPAPPYAAFAEWLAKRPVDKARQFWTDRLRDFDTPTGIPGADLRQKLERAPLSIRDGQVAGPAYRDLLEACRRSRATVSTAIRGAWGRMLLDRCGGEQVLYGATTSLRSAPIDGIDRMTGFLITWTPVVQDRNEVGDDWLLDFQEQQTAAQAHAFADPRAVHRWSGAGFEWPLFDTVVTVQNYPGASRPMETEGLVLRTVFAREQVHYPLSLVARPGESSLGLQLTYDARRLGDELAEDVLEQVLGELSAFSVRTGTR